MAVTSMAASVAGALNSAVGSYFAAQGQKTALELQAKMAQINAKISEGQARDALLRGERTEQASRLKAAQVKSAQRAAIAANGIDLGSETAVALQTSTDVLSELDANTIKANALRDAWGFRMEAVGLRGQADVTRATASGINPFLSAAGTLLTEGARVGSQFQGLQSSGALGGGSSGGGFWSNVGGGRP